MGNYEALKQPLRTSRCRLSRISRTNSCPVPSGCLHWPLPTHTKLDPISGLSSLLVRPPTVSFSETPKWATPLAAPKFPLSREALSEPPWARTSLWLQPLLRCLPAPSRPSFYPTPRGSLAPPPTRWRRRQTLVFIH